MAAPAFVDFHCHTSASFDSIARPADVARAAAARGLTHLAITDHGRIDAALRLRDAAPDGLTVIVGEEIKTQGGDLIALFLETPVPGGLTAAEAIAAVRAQGGLVGIPHPFDRFRSSMLRRAALESIGELVDWVEAWNARVVGGGGNERAAEFALAHGLPGVAASDAHSVVEVGVAYTILEGDPATPAGLLAALPSARIVPGRGSYVARLITPVAKALTLLDGRLRGRAPDGGPGGEAGAGTVGRR